MTWDGKDRRSSGDGALREIHQRIDDHLEAERKDAERIATLEVQLAELLDPEKGRLARLEANIAAILEIKQQATGGVRMLMILGSIAVAGASFWAWVSANINIAALLKK